MLIELGAIAAGMVVSYFLKDVQFLSLNFSFLYSGIIHPDFLLIFIMFFALSKGEFSGTWVGFFSGLMEDGANWVFNKESEEFVTIIGIHSLVYSLAAFSVGKARQFFDRQNSISLIFTVLFTTALIRLLTWILQGLLVEFNRNYVVIGPAIYTALIAPVWFTLLSWAYRIGLEDKK